MNNTVIDYIDHLHEQLTEIYTPEEVLEKFDYMTVKGRIGGHITKNRILEAYFRENGNLGHLMREFDTIQFNVGLTEYIQSQNNTDDDEDDDDDDETKYYAIFDSQTGGYIATGLNSTTLDSLQKDMCELLKNEVEPHEYQEMLNMKSDDFFEHLKMFDYELDWSYSEF